MSDGTFAEEERSKRSLLLSLVRAIMKSMP